MIKLKSAEEWKDIFMQNPDITAEEAIDWLKDIQRNCVEYTLQIASENADADIEFMGWLADQHERMKFIEGEDYEVYVINSSIIDLKETIFKDNNL